MESGKNLLDILDLSCTRGQKNLFSSLSCQLSAGHLLLVEGANGSGKSSLLRLLAGFSTPDAGEVRWQGQSIHENKAAYHAHLHYIGHNNGLKQGLTAAENIQLTQHLFLSAENTEQSAILDEFALSAHYHQPVYRLSAGQQRRLALVKLFLFPKQIWILDEPLTSLDTAAQDFFLLKLAVHIKKGGIAMISSHQTICLPDITTHTLRLSAC